MPLSFWDEWIFEWRVSKYNGWFLEKRFNRRMMSTCHGMYSLGGGVSAGLATIFFALGLSPRVQVILVAATILTVIYFNRKHLLAHDRIIHSGSGLKFPSLSILSISFLCMVLFMAEGCVADWSAIYLRESLHGTKEIMGLGYAGFFCSNDNRKNEWG
jgi:hypothetical protein